MSMKSWLAMTFVATGLAMSGCGVGANEEFDEETGELTTISEAELKCTKDTWSNFAKGLFANNCSSCHGKQFSTKAKVKASGARAAIKSGRMPRAGALSATDKSRIEKWFSCGAP